MRTPKKLVPDALAEVSVGPQTPEPGGGFDALLNEYRPPEEPFRVILPHGQVFLFKAVQDAGSWQTIIAEATRMAARLVQGVPVALSKAASKDPQRNALAFICERTMVGWYASSVLGEDGYEVVGEMRAKWSLEEWLRFANMAPVVFDAIHAKVDAGQVQAKRTLDSRTIAREKKG